MLRNWDVYTLITDWTIEQKNGRKPNKEVKVTGIKNIQNKIGNYLNRTPKLWQQIYYWETAWNCQSPEPKSDIFIETSNQPKQFSLTAFLKVCLRAERPSLWTYDVQVVQRGNKYWLYLSFKRSKFHAANWKVLNLLVSVELILL